MNQLLINRIFKGYQQCDRLDTDPEGSIPFGIATNQTYAICQVWPITPDQAMDLNSNQLIDGIHHSLQPNQALIEVNCGKTASNKDYIYSIVKTLKEPHGAQYFVLLDYWETPSSVLRFQGFFEENGTTGVRDASIFSAFAKNHPTDVVRVNWLFDPYDPNFKHPTLMNQSERPEFDSFFPEHPLSMAREFAGRVIDE